MIKFFKRLGFYLHAISKPLLIALSATSVAFFVIIFFPIPYFFTIGGVFSFVVMGIIETLSKNAIPNLRVRTMIWATIGVAQMLAWISLVPIILTLPYFIPAITGLTFLFFAEVAIDVTLGARFSPLLRIFIFRTLVDFPPDAEPLRYQGRVIFANDGTIDLQSRAARRRQPLQSENLSALQLPATEIQTLKERQRQAISKISKLDLKTLNDSQKEIHKKYKTTLSKLTTEFQCGISYDALSEKSDHEFIILYKQKYCTKNERWETIPGYVHHYTFVSFNQYFEPLQEKIHPENREKLFQDPPFRYVYHRYQRLNDVPLSFELTSLAEQLLSAPKSRDQLTTTPATSSGIATRNIYNERVASTRGFKPADWVRDDEFDIDDYPQFK